VLHRPVEPADKSGHFSALAHIANSGIFPVQSLKQGTKCRISTTRPLVTILLASAPRPSLGCALGSDVVGVASSAKV
jgi:hypothetical protein